MTTQETSSLQDNVASSNPLMASGMARQPDFLGEIDESRQIGRFRDDLTNGDKLALQNFMVREFDLEQLEVLRGASEAPFVVEQHECLHTQIDLLCLDVAVPRECESALVARLLKLLSPKGLVCIESNDKSERIDADWLPEGAFETVMAVPGFSVFAQIKGERSPRSVRYQIDLFRRQRYVARKRRERLAADPKTPEVAVFVLTYKHEAFIAQCLRSVMKQRGPFTMRVLIIDDASPDKTAQVARSIIAENRDPRIKFELRVNPQNVGASANWGPALDWAKGADYVAPCDGDDFWSSDSRIQAHIEFIREHPSALMSFNSFEFCTIDSSERRRGIHLDGEIVSASRIAKDNPVGHLGSTFYCGELVDIFPLEPFYYINGDWMINLYCSQISQIGYLDEALSVYRLHGGGVWSLKTGLDRIIPMIYSISKCNAFLDFNYHVEFDWLIKDCFRALSQVVYGAIDDLGKIDIIIICDEAPRKNNFFYSECTAYLQEFQSSLLLAPLNGCYQRCYPDLGSRVIEDDGTFPLHLGKLIYAANLTNLFAKLPRIEDAGAPFVFTLCPNGGFTPNDPDVIRQLKRIFSSPCFQKVIVTQYSIYDYVASQSLCPAEKVELIYGGLLSSFAGEHSLPKRRWGFGKSELDICIAPNRDARLHKGACDDVIVDVVKALQERFDNIRLHVLSALSARCVNVDTLGDRIKFYGPLNPDKFDRFFQDMDIILSNNVVRRSCPGAIEGFLSDPCIEAGARGVTIFAVDQFNDAKGHFTDGLSIVIVKPEVDDLIGKIGQYYANPEALKSIGEMGAQAIHALFCPEAQLTPRVNLLREAMNNPAPVGEALALRVKIAALQSEIAHRDEILAAMTAPKMKRKRKLKLLSRGLRRVLTGRSDTTVGQIFKVYRASGLRGVRRALRNIGG